MTSRKVQVDVVVVNWNTGRQLHECLAALSDSRPGEYRFGHVVVVDNDSSDSSARNLDFPKLPLQVIFNPVNRGFAAASNQGAALCTNDYLLFLNPDTRVDPDTVAKSVQFMESPEYSGIGTMGVQLVDENGEISRDCSRFLATKHFMNTMLGLNRIFPSAFPEHLYADWDHSQSRAIEHVMGSYFFVRNAVFRSLGRFDERFFVYYEDVDFSLRALRAGWATYFYTGARCYHRGGGSTRQIKARRLFYILRSRIFYAFKNFGPVDATFLLLATLFIEPLTRTGQGVLRGSFTQIREVAQAYLLLWKELPEILKSDFLRKTEPIHIRVVES